MRFGGCDLTTETLADKILKTALQFPGKTDRELSDIIGGLGTPQQAVNQAARRLAEQGLLVRQTRADGLIGNYRSSLEVNGNPSAQSSTEVVRGSEDDLKRHLKKWLETNGWSVKVAWGKQRGVDIEATKDNLRWLIEVKGPGSRDAMRVNYFIGMIGEIVQRMESDACCYSIAMPDLQQFRRLWDRLHPHAKNRLAITALFVAESGEIEISN